MKLPPQASKAHCVGATDADPDFAEGVPDC